MTRFWSGWRRELTTSGSAAIHPSPSEDIGGRLFAFTWTSNHAFCTTVAIRAIELSTTCLRCWVTQPIERPWKFFVPQSIANFALRVTPISFFHPCGVILLRLGYIKERGVVEVRLMTGFSRCLGGFSSWIHRTRIAASSHAIRRLSRFKSIDLNSKAHTSPLTEVPSLKRTNRIGRGRFTNLASRNGAVGKIGNKKVWGHGLHMRACPAPPSNPP